MSTLNCPICATVPLGAPYQFAGQWLAACSKCHSEIELRQVEASGAPEFKLTSTMKLATLREAEHYRRRTVF
jgi:hypothetical protein